MDPGQSIDAMSGLRGFPNCLEEDIPRSFAWLNRTLHQAFLRKCCDMSQSLSSFPLSTSFWILFCVLARKLAKWSLVCRVGASHWQHNCLTFRFRVRHSPQFRLPSSASHLTALTQNLQLSKLTFLCALGARSPPSQATLPWIPM